MDPLLARIVLGLALVGNAALAVGFLNRSHGLGAWRPLIHGCSLLSLLAFLAGPIVIVATIVAATPDCLPPMPAAVANVLTTITDSRLSGLAAVYTLVCAVASVAPMIAWCAYLMRREPAQLARNHTIRLCLAGGKQGGRRAHGVGRLAAALPGNETFCLDVTEKTLVLPRLPARLDGLSIAHLSDLHMCGRVDVGYFRDVVDQIVARKPDLVAITGDIVDRSRCLAWIPETLGGLTAPCGVYYVLGNHDRQVDLSALRSCLAQSGLIGLGGEQRTVEVADEIVLLAGNELPWIRPAPEISTAVPKGSRQPALRILLSHSPDQISWARRRGFDLMLAGHTHGGQIRLPLFGPLLAPSLHGTKYASGTFFEPPTVLHVSRGVSGLTPIRYNCRPEVSVLRLVCSPATRGLENTADAAALATQSTAG